MSEPKVRSLRALQDRFSTRHASAEGPQRFFHGQLARLTEGAEALHRLFIARNPTETQAAHVKRTTLSANRLGRETTATINRIAESYRLGLDGLAARIKARTNLSPDGYASELRGVYRAMPPKERDEFLARLVAENRGPELAALTKPPSVLTGISDEHRARWESDFIARHAPEESAERAALDAAFEDALVSTKTAGEIATAYADPAQLAEITRAEAAAAAAAQSFEAATRS